MSTDVVSGELFPGKGREDIAKNSQYVFPFRHSDLKRSTRFYFKAKRIKQRSFLNALNFRNFISDHVYVQAVHTHLKEKFLIVVSPGACSSGRVTMTLPESSLLSFADFSLEALLIDNGTTVMVMDIDLVNVTDRSFCAELHQFGYAYHSRRERRFPCRMVDAVIHAEDGEYYGTLSEFNASGLRINLKDRLWAGHDAARVPSQPITIELFRGCEKLFSGPSQLIRIEEHSHTVVFAPMNIEQKKFNERKFRNTRLALVPAPQAVFIHPFTGKNATYDICDITTSGFSFLMESDCTTIVPGMILSRLQVVFAGGLSLECSAQALYLKKQRGNLTKAGFLITDMDPVTYTRLFNILTRADDPHSLAPSKVPIDALWEFFFRSGFIYPDKYLSLSNNKEHFKNTYKKLYHDCPDIFSSLTYQRNDQIYGHVSIVRAYPYAWMVQHLAALPMGNKRTGLFILRQMLNYLDGFHRMPSIGMKYLMFNYRPDNKFPNYFFGGVCAILNAPRMCSVDEFAYLTYRLPEEETVVPAGCTIRACNQEDLAALHEAYHRHSPGLMIESFGLEMGDNELRNSFASRGLKRRCTPHVLIRDNRRVCFFIVDQYDLVLNMSDLLNSIKVIIPDPDPQFLPWRMLLDVISCLGKEYRTADIVLQVFPSSYLDKAGVRYPKKYCLWIAKTSYFDPYYDAIREMTRFSILKYFKSYIETRLGLRK